MSGEFEAVIGLEIHCQLSTESKIFCGCRARVVETSVSLSNDVADSEVNSNICPVCAAHPGTLPVLNRKVVEYAVRAGLATHCAINRKNVFARKNYFYPDLPKGYQISQYDQPICENGHLTIMMESGPKQIRIQRIHMEEDAGKNVHMSDCSLVNLNRAGVPLIEIVSHPDMKTAQEAGAYMRALHALVTCLGICDGNLQEGNFRCDANVSVMPKGSTVFGTRTETKNVNSFRFVEKAIDYEIARQIAVIKSGGKVVLETRGYDSQKNVTASQRSKEEAHDYRYFPDPDLIPVAIDEAWVERIRAALPELPEQKRARYMSGDFGLSAYDAEAVSASKQLATFFEEAVRLGAVPKRAANLITGEITRLLNEDAIEIGASKLTPGHIADLDKLLQNSTVSSTGAKQVLASVWKTGDEVGAIVECDGLRQVSDMSSFEPVIDQVIRDCPAQVAEFKSGKDKLLGFFVGQVMKQTGGKANPAVLQELIRKKLNA